MPKRKSGDHQSSNLDADAIRATSRRKVVATLIAGAAGAAVAPTPVSARHLNSYALPNSSYGLLVEIADRLFFVPWEWMRYFELTNVQPNLTLVKRRLRAKDKKGIRAAMFGYVGDPNLPHPLVAQGVAAPVVVPPTPDEVYLAESVSPTVIDSN